MAGEAERYDSSGKKTPLGRGGEITKKKLRRLKRQSI